MTVSERIRQFIRERARFLCEYCHSPEKSSSEIFTIDHLVPRSLGGSDEPDNLALACRRCNERRYNFTTGVDPQTQQEVAIFNPRLQQWDDHFVWTADGLRLIGITPTGRATCNRLDLNDEFHNQGFIQAARQLWLKGGWHPPPEDRRRKR
ncbi:HNH endonuclease [Kovacikia minuta CCNUW1]|uniref:HNH endonuclease n=1 Tax=Kovacikia minuta TaxID=2931930 RepID=UPI001CCAFA77|nr:HNH endonuclease signature motif containing protein [Kovacikia minuta]UBF25095.1 HNH endonuclease [Kovacikia minuta CCNUW1]